MLNWSNTRKARFIGALFHDIGKFQYRAEKTRVRHEENSANFIREYLGKHTCLKDFLEESIRIAASHHDSSSGDVALRRADQVAAGEREEEEEKQARRPLLSMFTHIGNVRPEVTAEVEKRYFKPGRVSTKDIFPEVMAPETVEDDESLREWHRPHWEGFLKDMKALPHNLSFETLVHTLFAILEKWTSRVSSAGYKSLPDISLFDHLRVVAAYADCYSEADDRDKPFLVIEADISGIQSFIYRIANISEGDDKGTAKTLRGRSFLIGLYAEAVASYLIQQLNLLNAHVLLNGGGGFTIMAPNQKEIRERLPKLRSAINRWLFEQFQGEIGLILAWEAFSEDEIRTFGKIKRRMLIKVGDEKHHRNFDQLGDETFWRPIPFDEGSITQRCKRCGNYISKEEGGLCTECKKHHRIGQILPHTQTILYIRDGDVPLEDTNEYVPISVQAFNQTWVLVRERAENQTVHDIIKRILKDFPTEASVDIIRLNETDFLEDRFVKLSGSHQAGVGFQFRFLGNFVPKDEKHDVLSFEELADLSEGYPRIGVLRMDVDSLGAIFAYGFKPEHQTISRIANLSRLFVLFFGGYINHLAEKYQVYINYSGGDDLFVVGGWTGVIDFARQVHDDFEKFVSVNPHLTISGGMVIVWPSYPIRFAAEEAAVEEDNAKDKDANTPGEKNAFSLWEETHHWENFNKLIEWANQLVELIHEKEAVGVALRSLLYYVKALRESSFDRYGKQNPFWIHKVRHKIHYALRRRAKLGKKELEAAEKSRLAAALAPLIHDPHGVEHIKLPADYAILKTREKKDNSK